MYEYIDKNVLKKIKGYKRIAALVLGAMSAYGLMTYEIWMTDMELVPKILTIMAQWSAALGAGLNVAERTQVSTDVKRKE